MPETVTDRLLDFLRSHHVDMQVLTHPPVRTSEEAARVRGTPLEQGAKALVFHADTRHVLLVVPAQLRADTRRFKREFGVKDLKMISPNDLLQLTGLEVGAVPPFGHLLGFQTYVDVRLLELPRIAFNAGSRSTSVVMAPMDFQRLEQPIVGHFALDESPAT
jgi:Ala-tRNA(Pro) deacylase